MLTIQIDFSLSRNVTELRYLLRELLGDAPILFSLLGNTLSNFSEDGELLKSLASLLKPNDRFLIEVASTANASPALLRRAEAEYNASKLFKEFVTSSLLQNTDIHISLGNVVLEGRVEGTRAILVNSLYRNNINNIKKNSIKVALPDRSVIDFDRGDTIRLYTTRKYTPQGIKELLLHSGLRCLTKAKQLYSHSPEQAFGTELLLVQLDENCVIEDKSYGATRGQNSRVAKEGEMWIEPNPFFFHKTDFEIKKNQVFVIFSFSLEKTIYPMIAETLEKHKYTAIYAKDRAGQVVFNDVWLLLNQSELVVVDFTEKRPNVYLEFGMALVLGKPIVCICQDAKDMPSDVPQLKRIVYKNLLGDKELETQLPRALKDTLADFEEKWHRSPNQQASKS